MQSYSARPIRAPRSIQCCQRGFRDCKVSFFCQTKLCQELLDGLGQDIVQAFGSWTMNVNDFGDPLTFPLALP